MRRGPLLMVLASVAFTGMVGMVKVARAELDAVDIVFWRGLVGVPFAAWLARRSGLRIHDRPLVAPRCALGFAGMVAYFDAAFGLSLASVSLIARLQPLLIAWLAPVLLGDGERPGWRVWALLSLGLCGSIILLGGDLMLGSSYAILALVATLLSAGTHLSLRALARTDHAPPIVFWFQVTATAAAAAWLLIRDGGALAVPSAHLWGPLAGVGVLSVSGQLLMTRGYALDRAPVVAAASYTEPAFAALADALFFATLPDAPTWVGGAMVISAGGALLFMNEGRAVEAAPTRPP